MEIYTIEPVFDKYKTYVPKNEEYAYKVFGSLACKAQKLNWPETLELVFEDDNGLTEISDISTIQIGSLVFNQKAYNCLNETLNKYGEFLPMKHGDAQLWLYNVINIVDALDSIKSEFNEFGGIKTPVFNCEALKNELIYKIKEDNYTSIFCTQEFKDIIEKNQLTGLEFISEECI